MKQNFKIFLAALAIVILIAGVAGLFLKKEVKASIDTDVSNKQKEFITLKTTETLGNVGIVEIGEEKGFFEEQGIKIEKVGSIQGGTEGVQALAAGSIDFTSSAWAPWINAISRDARLKVVVAASGQNARETGQVWIVLENSSIKTAKDLVGKKIAVNVLGAEADYVTREYLRHNGLSIDQVQLVVVPWPQHEQVLRSGQADVVVAIPPFSNKILDGGGARVLLSGYDVRGETASIGLGVREDLIKQKPEAVKRFVAAVAKAYDWSANNPEEARKVVAEIYTKKGGNPDLAKYWTPNMAWEHGLIKDEDVQWWLNWFVRDGIIREGQLKPSNVYTNEFNPYFEK